MKFDCHTDSGMLCIWDYDSFKHIHDYNSWEEELCEEKDLENKVRLANFVPLNLLADGAFQVEVRLDKPNFSSREQEYLLVPAQPYRIVTNGVLYVSGLEHVEGDPCLSAGKIETAPGEYVVQVNMIDWAQEPGAKDDKGNPSKEALPDLIVFVFQDPSVTEFRLELETFRREDALR